MTDDWYFLRNQQDDDKAMSCHESSSFVTSVDARLLREAMELDEGSAKL
jgi:hypothetical protein